MSASGNLILNKNKRPAKGASPKKGGVVKERLQDEIVAPSEGSLMSRNATKICRETKDLFFDPLAWRRWSRGGVASSFL